MNNVTVHIGTLYIDLYMESSHSLKGKRMILKKLKNNIRQNFNVSVAELDREDKWQTATIGISMINVDQKYIDGAFHKITDWVDNYYAVELVNSEIEFF